LSHAGSISSVTVAAKRYPKTLRLKNGAVVRLPAVMGILNVTPDSFYEGSRFLDPKLAGEHALEMEEAGADIIDVGGESTRPGARALPAAQELERVIPVIRELGRRLRVPISIDTRRAEVARAAFAEGAVIVNDVSALGFDPEMGDTVAGLGATVVLMHMRGTPDVMTRLARYRNVVEEVRAALAERARGAIRAGIPRSRIILDPGLGFAKTAVHNLKLLGALPRICSLGYPVMIGASRKTFVRRIAGPKETDLLFGTAAAGALAVAAGASIIRVHDPGPMAAVVRMAAAVAAHHRNRI
jgi:dihydropteroate synthase